MGVEGWGGLPPPLIGTVQYGSGKGREREKGKEGSLDWRFQTSLFSTLAGVFCSVNVLYMHKTHTNTT